MKISRLKIENFRGISSATLFLPDHVVLIGDNNTGKSTILEALNLVLGPDRLNRKPPIDEHDFYQGRYLVLPSDEPGPEGDVDDETEKDDPAADASTTSIWIECVITGLSDDQIAHFADAIEWWNEATDEFVEAGAIDVLDGTPAVPALRVTFIGRYDSEEDDFDGQTYFARGLEETPERPQKFGKRDKQLCGFLYLRALRTGSRALSLEHGSLLDIILRLKELRPQMWEETINHLSSIDVASNRDLGISGILESVNDALKRYVPREWGATPRLRVSSMTRDHLRKVITAFMATGEGDHAAPFYRQGTGTINMLVLALLSQVAEDKQNVMFAMEEPETAIPPYAQKRIVHELRKLSAQSIVTSHSPYVLEEYDNHQTVILARGEDGALTQSEIELPSAVKPRTYRREFRTRFCEGLLGRRVLVTEGETEADALPVVARRLHELDPETYTSLDALGLTIVNAGSDSKVGPLGGFYRGLGKTVYGLCDRLDAPRKAEIEAQLDGLFMHDQHGFEDLVLENTTEAALSRFASLIDWPPHLAAEHPKPDEDARAAVSAYFKWSKGDAGIADYLAQCEIDEIPDWLKETCARLKQLCEPSSTEASAVDETSNDGGGDQA